MRAFIFVAALLLAARACEGAALLRFINTVPTRLSASSSPAALSYSVSLPYSTATTGTAHVTGDQLAVDRVGLSYYATAVTSASSVLSPTIVWTEPYQVNPTTSSDTVYSSLNSPYAWTHAMPSLRQAHSVSGVTVGTNGVQTATTVGTYADSVDQITGSTLTGADDWLDQAAWKADGVGLYLSFAAGTYQMQAYGVLGASTAASSYSATVSSSVYQGVQRAFTGATGQFTFADQAVYTLVAIGNGQYLATPTPLVGNTVTLQLFQESTAPATFGMATVRWFHAIRSYSTATISVFPGDASSNPALVSGIPFGGLSNYVDVAPNLMQVFPITASTTTGVIAPVSANRLEVTHDLRAGVRATIICAMNNEADAKVFCRQIPSRVVAYVRLVNDLAGTSSPTSGAFGAVPLKYVNLSLFASYEYPRPEQTYELSQSGAERSLWNSPANMRGLYGAVTSVAAGTVSGYGEVFVPLFIMDFATRFSVASDSIGDLGTAMSGSGATPNAYATPNQILPIPQEVTATVGSNVWFFGAPIVKRVNFIVKTDSGATLSGIASGAESAVQRLYNFPMLTAALTAATGNTVAAQGGATVASLYATTGATGWYANAVTVDNYLEPGQYYTIIAQATYPASNAASTVPVTNTMAIPSAVTFYWRLDRTLSQVSSGIPTGQGAVNWIPVGKSANYQDFSSGKVNLRPGSTSTTTTYSASGLAATAATGTMSNTPSATPGNTLPTDLINTAPTFTVPAAAYTFDFTAGSTQTCYNGFTGSTALTISSGDVWDIYVLNVYGCLANSNNLNMLSIVPVKTQSALMTNNAAGTLLSPSASSTNTASPTFFFGAAPALSVSMSFIIATIFAAIATLL